ncbi:MAG: hypothetical protein GEU90_21870 [Gemmatimonas sp.]|nr:hypothetical protein [Gemmatimonas sp.]
MRVAFATLIGVIVVALAPTHLYAQAMESVEPFHVATFEVDGEQKVGLVLRDQIVVEIDAANENLQQDPAFPTVPIPGTMLELIGQYEYGLKYRLYEIVNHLVADGTLEGGNRPSYVDDVANVDIQAPIQYPGKILNAAGNFYTHICEGCTEAELAASTRERQENRGVPYMFLKSSRGAVIGTGENIELPEGRDRTDWEVEFATVIGRTGKYVPASEAQDYVFGYMVSIDVSDRGGRPPGGFGSGSDWFVGKGHDTFAPQGPWITPKEFYGDPMERLHQTLTIDGQMIQEAQAGDMIHSIWEIIEYASSVNTLYPGDVVNSGTSGGTSMGALETGERAGYLEPGERIEATIEGIGTLVHEVVAGEMPPDNLSGAQLPPVSSYQDVDN